jgi:hypothetical protein
MPRQSRKDQLAKKQDPAALELFDLEGLPHREDLVRNIAERRYEHTGARLLDDDGKALRLVEMLISQVPVARIARELGISRHTVRRAHAALVATGKLAHYKERIAQLYEQICEGSAINYRNAVEANLVPVGQIPIGAGIFHDKRAQTLGEVTSVSVGIRAAPQEALSVETINRTIENLGKPGAIESASTGFAPVCSETEKCGADLGTSPRLLGPGNPEPAAPPAPPPSPDPTPDPRPSQGGDPPPGGGSGDRAMVNGSTGLVQEP